MKYYNYYVVCIPVMCFILILESCNKPNISEKDIDKVSLVALSNEVKTLTIEKGHFHNEIISNGKLSAVQKSQVQFKVGEVISGIKVANGQFVKKGEVLAVLEDFQYRQNLRQAENELKKARLAFQDQLFGRGYNLEDSTQKIPKEIYDAYAIHAGYFDALLNVEKSKFEYEHTILRAPFAGVVANVTLKQYDHANAGEDFCLLLNNNVFEVDFSLTESEVGTVNKGDNIEVQTFIDTTIYKGYVSSINPVVDENGMVLTKAIIQNEGDLMEGMNVRVLIKKGVAGQLIVPKSAVVIRQDQEVLFKYQQGKAYWTYVETLYENSTSYAVRAHPDKSSAMLSAGDTIIVSDNLNLAHDSEVRIGQAIN